VFSGGQHGIRFPARLTRAVISLETTSITTFVYETALRHPGVVAMHESNCNHLMAELTIKRGDWDAYIREVRVPRRPRKRPPYAARRGGKLEVGSGLRRRGDDAARHEKAPARGGGTALHREEHARGPRSPAGGGDPRTGAWMPEADRNAYRQRLGLDETIPLVGVSVSWKPTTDFAESLRAFRRLVRLVPNCPDDPGGEPHPGSR